MNKECIALGVAIALACILLGSVTGRCQYLGPGEQSIINQQALEQMRQQNYTQQQILQEMQYQRTLQQMPQPVPVQPARPFQSFIWGFQQGRR